LTCLKKSPGCRLPAHDSCLVSRKVPVLLVLDIGGHAVEFLQDVADVAGAGLVSATAK
jgi:hypothetical protein